MKTLPHTLHFPDGTSIDTEAADRLLGLGDQFLENWEADDADLPVSAKDADLPERKAEWAKIRPLFVAAPTLLSACAVIARAGDVRDDARRALLHGAIADAGAWSLLDPRLQAASLRALGGTKVDPLTIAYVAMGAQQAIQAMESGHLPHQVSDHYGGQWGFIQAITNEAWRLDAVIRAIVATEDGLDGVYLYEVAEPFGEQFARALVAEYSGDAPEADADAIARRLFDGFSMTAGTAPRDYEALLSQGARMEHAGDHEAAEEEPEGMKP